MENKNLLLIGILLPTEDSSHLMLSNIKDKEPELVLSALARKSGAGWNSHHLYLCSDREIKKNNYFYNATSETVFKNDMGLNVSQNYPNESKIEFTTDPKLIADGVPAIDGNTKVFIECDNAIIVGNKTHFEKITADLEEVDFLSEYCKRYNQKDVDWESQRVSSGNSLREILEPELQKDNQKGVDVEELAKELARKEANHPMNNKIKLEYQDGIFYGFQQGFKANQALQSNTGSFSESDVRKAISMGRSIRVDGKENTALSNYSYTKDEIIQSLTPKPKGEIVIECEMEKYNWHYPANEPDSGEWDYKMKLDNGQPILIFK